MELVDGFTVQAAAVALNVSRARVQAMISTGELIAERVGRQWIIPRHAVFAYAKNPRLTGRPFAEASAWHLIADLNRGLVPLDWLDSNRQKLTRRSDSLVGRALPELIDRLLRNRPSSFVLGGAFAAALHGAATRPMTPPIDVYVAEPDLSELADSIEFVELTATPNATLHVISAASWELAHFESGTTDLVTAWLDLIEAGDRSSDEAWRALLGRQQ